MALSVIDQPTDIVLARNPAILQLRAAQTVGGDLYSAVGVSASISVLLADRFAAGETLTVDYEAPDGTTESIDFTAAGSYSDIDEIPDDTFSGSDAEYWTALAAIVDAHPRIAPFFSCEPVTVMGSLTIKVLARSTDTGWSVELTNDAGFTATTDAGSADTTPDNYRVLVEVFFERSYLGGDYELVAQMEGLPNTDNGWLYFDVSAVLAAQCQANRLEPMVPIFGSNAPMLADNLRRYYIRYTEEYGSPSEVQTWQYTAVKYVMDGGVSQSVQAQAGYFGYLSEKSSTNAFLTWMPDRRTLGLSQPEYLAWYNHTGAQKRIILELIRYDVDTGAASAKLYAYESENVVVQPMQTCLIPVAIDILESELSFSLASDQYKIAVRVVDYASDWEGGSPSYLSESRSYLVDRTYYESSRYVQYLNAFGVPECWRCTGEWSKKLNVSRQLGKKPIQPDYNEMASDTFQYAAPFNPQLVYRTGYLRKGEAEVLQELLVAGEVYDVSADGYIPLLLTSNAFDVTSTRQALHAYQFTVQPRLDMKNFSKKEVSTATADAWQEPDNEYWFDALLVPWQG